MQSESIAKLAEAIAKAQSELKPVKKECSNPFYHSKYADLASVWEALKPFHANGVAITQSPRESSDGQIYLDTQLTHLSGEWMRSTICLPLAKVDPQGVGSALTYARRYALGCMTGVVTEEDDDGNATVAKPSTTPAQAHTMQKKQAAKKIAELRTEKPAQTEDQWELFLDYMADDPDRTNVGKQLKTLLAIGTVADLEGEARTSFILQFQDACRDLGIPCETWVKDQSRRVS